MAAALTVLLIGCLLQTALCGKAEVFIPQTIEVLSGSCVTIPCSFDVEDKYNSLLDETCRALWKSDKQTVVFNSSNPQSGAIRGELKGDLKRKDCTTTLNNMRPEHSKEYFLRVQCAQLKYSFLDHKLHISVTDAPPTPTLTPSTLKVEEGTSLSLKCSAPAPCLSHPPALTWTSSLGHIQDSLQENLDRTKVQTSVLNFTASRLHHGKIISCTAVYNKQDGRSHSVRTSLTADVSYAPKHTTVSVSPSGSVLEDTDVTLTCSSAANPAVKTYTWYRADGGQETVMGTGHVLNITASKVSGPFFCEAENAIGSGRSNISQIDVHYFPMLPVFITIFVVLFLLICGLLLVIRARRTHRIDHKSTDATSQGLTSGEANEVPNAEEAIYSNATEVRQEDVADPAATSEPSSANLPSAGPNNAEGAAEDSEKKKKEGSDVIYTNVSWKTKSKKKKEEETVDMGQPGSSYLEEERDAVGAMSRNFVSDALEMGNLYDEFKLKNKAVECEYAQVEFKRKSVMRK